jgi:YHS domain-containing protein
MIHALTQQLTRFTRLALGAATVAASQGALAAPAINTLEGGVFGGRGDTAIRGYDTVAYFTEGKPVKGQDAFVTEWMGAKWKFASKAHLDRFKASPDKYAPQYGGYCAFGVAQGYLVKVEPDQFKILDGKLYLNYDASVQATWLKDPAGYIRTADAKFAQLISK